MKALKTEHKWALLCLKYIPIIMFLTMWIYTILALFGYSFVLADTIMGCAIVPSIMIFALAKVFFGGIFARYKILLWKSYFL